jgi:hypothetical protein
MDCVWKCSQKAHWLCASVSAAHRAGCLLAMVVLFGPMIELNSLYLGLDSTLFRARTEVKRGWRGNIISYHQNKRHTIWAIRLSPPLCLPTQAEKKNGVGGRVSSPQQNKSLIAGALSMMSRVFSCDGIMPRFLHKTKITNESHWKDNSTLGL